MIFSVQIKQLLRIKALFTVEIPQVLSNGDNCTANPGQWRHSKLVYFTRSWMRFRFISLVDGVNMGQEDGCVAHSGGLDQHALPTSVACGESAYSAVEARGNCPDRDKSPFISYSLFSLLTSLTLSQNYSTGIILCRNSKEAGLGWVLNKIKSYTVTTTGLQFLI